MRKRTTLEEAGLLKRVGADVNRVKDIHAFNALFEGLAVRTDEHFREAYNEARQFGKVLGKRGKGGGFMKNLMQHIIFSQYYDTAHWLADALATRFPDEAIGLYASGTKPLIPKRR